MIRPASATTAIITIQLAAGLSAPFSMSLMTLLCSRITPPTPIFPVASIRKSSTPDSPRNPASVTTNEGNRSQVMMNPCSAP